MTRFFDLWSENDHHPILKEVVVLNRVGIHPLAFNVVNPTEISDDRNEKRKENLLFLRKINLETNDIPVLNLTLCERHFGFHQLNHPRFDFLPQYIGISNVQAKTAYLIELNGCTWRPPHSLVYDRDQVTHFARPWQICLSSAQQGLFRCVKVLQKYHY